MVTAVNVNCHSDPERCHATQRKSDRTGAVHFDLGSCIRKEVRSWSLKDPPLNSPARLKGHVFKELRTSNLLRASDNLLRTNNGVKEGEGRMD